jgi:hypothetical protein
MDNISETQAVAFTPACVKLPSWVASAPAVDGRLTRVSAAKAGLSGVKGTGMPAASDAHAQQCVRIRKPYNYTTRLSAFSGADPGPHPAREPEPV